MFDKNLGFSADNNFVESIIIITTKILPVDFQYDLVYKEARVLQTILNSSMMIYSWCHVQLVLLYNLGIRKICVQQIRSFHCLAK